MAMFISDPSSALATTGSLAGISEPRANKGSDMKKGHVIIYMHRSDKLF